MKFQFAHKAGRCCFFLNASETLWLLSFATANFVDGYIILTALAIDTTLSFLQLWRSEHIVQSLKKNLEKFSQVVRGGSLKKIPTKELVPGDIIHLRSGSSVPADARILTAHGLRTQESILTGEASEIVKEVQEISQKTPLGARKNMLYAGTFITGGSGIAVVTATGAKTEFGKIAEFTQTLASPPSPLRKALSKAGFYIGSAIVFSILLLGALQIFSGASLLDTLRTSLTLIVSAIPEDLTMVLTVVLSVGAGRILRAGGVVRGLSSAETLGTTSVLCTDKTGTLTQGNMQAVSFVPARGEALGASVAPESHALTMAYTGLALANDAYATTTNKKTSQKQYFGSATERAALSFVELARFSKANLQKSWKTKANIPFHSAWKYRAVSVSHPTNSSTYIFASGAPEQLLHSSSYAYTASTTPALLTSKTRHAIQQSINSYAKEGKRLLAITMKEHTGSTLTSQDVSQLVFLGFLVIEDPVREDATLAIKEMEKSGVHVKLITGDHIATARSVARTVGIPVGDDSIYEGETIHSMSDQELSDALPSARIFARVEPLDKQRIVRLLQDRGEIVAMTGDGVNDAVALRAANIGVAMGTGSDVAKDASDLVLANNSLTAIVSAIKEWRVIRDNIVKVITFLLSTNLAEILLFFFSFLFGLPLPLLPAQILWINLVTDGTSDLALSFEKEEGSVLSRKPRAGSGDIFQGKTLFDIFYTGILLTVAVMSLYAYLVYKEHSDLTYIRTMLFTLLSVSSLLSAWSFRTLTTFFLRPRTPFNVLVPISMLFSISLHLLVIYTPSLQRYFSTVALGSKDWTIILSISFVLLLLIDMRKIVPISFAHKDSKVRSKELLISRLFPTH